MRRTGLHRLECADECGASLYATVAQLERHGCPRCPCGALFIPEHLEVAHAVLSAAQLDEHPAVAEYRAAVASVFHGQAGPARALRAQGKTFRDPAEIAMERVERDRRARARERQLSHLRRGPVDPAAHVVEEMPF